MLASPKSTERVETTLSFAKNPAISAVTICQLPNPKSEKTGAIFPAITAKMLSFEFETMLSQKSKVCKNQTMIEAIKITVKALCKKSFALSQSKRTTFLAPGIL